VKWEPWHEFKLDLELLNIPITEPPCKNCKLFKPRFDFSIDGKPNGVRLCQAERMYNDYSCYTEESASEPTIDKEAFMRP